MPDFSAVGALLTVYIWGVILPGPNFIAVSHKAVTGDLKRALALVAGIVTVNMFWATSAILGVAAVFAVFPWLALGVKLVGAAYLVWFGLRLIVTAKRALPDGPAESVAETTWHAYRRGVTVNIVNPKAIAFYAAVISSAAPAHVSVATLLAMLACIATISSGWYGAVAVFFSREAVVRWFRRSAATFNRVCGAALIALGLRNALAS